MSTRSGDLLELHCRLNELTGDYLGQSVSWPGWQPVSCVDDMSEKAGRSARPSIRIVIGAVPTGAIPSGEGTIYAMATARSACLTRAGHVHAISRRSAGTSKRRRCEEYHTRVNDLLGTSPAALSRLPSPKPKAWLDPIPDPTRSRRRSERVWAGFGIAEPLTKGLRMSAFAWKVSDGTRTRDRLDHNQIPPGPPRSEAAN
jgi:hypothetical protein